MKGYGDEEAIAPVVAVLLIMAVLITILSVYHTTYVPSLKETAEIEHLKEVENNFLAFSSDINNAVFQKQPGEISRSFMLGGGDVMLSPLKSGGYIKVSDSDRLFNITNTSGAVINSSLAAFKYESVGSFWFDTGYEWSYGYVNLTSMSRSTPLLYTDMNEVMSAVSSKNSLFGSLISVSYSENLTFGRDEVGKINGDVDFLINDIVITYVTFSKGNDYITGNGPAKLSLRTEVSETSFDENSVMFRINEELKLPVEIPVWLSLNDLIYNIREDRYANVNYDESRAFENPEYEDRLKEIGLVFTSPVKVTYRCVNISISV